MSTSIHPQAQAALVAAKNLPRWGIWSALLYVKKRSHLKLFILALKFELQKKDKLLWDYYKCHLI